MYTNQKLTELKGETTYPELQLSIVIPVSQYLIEQAHFFLKPEKVERF